MNYKDLGFKAGLEIHQQLPKRKLFSHEPTRIRKEKPDFTIQRILRARAGESGQIDKAAAHEDAKQKHFEYRGYNDTDSLVELDEEPPHQPCEQAIETALITARLLNMEIADSLQFMRKIVIDGSNVSGFQRTGLIGTNGYIEINGERIGIESLCLEEEACQVIKRTEEKDIYNLSRLGIPLLEIATAPDIKNPEQCKKVAAHLGMLLRSTEQVKRGIGTIRQDVNVSIKQGARTEIKGFQDYKNIPDVVKNEVKRQQKLIQNQEEVKKTVRKAEEDNTTTYLRPMPGADRMYLETDIEPVRLREKNVEVPQTITQRQKQYKENYDVSKHIAQKAVKKELNTTFSFKPILQKYTSQNLTPTNIIELYTTKKDLVDEDLFQQHIQQILTKLKQGKISFNTIDKILKELQDKKELNLKKYELLPEQELKQIIQNIIEENPDAPRGALMGIIMKETQGKADGAQANRLLQRLLE